MRTLLGKETRVFLALLAFGVTGGSAFTFIKLLVGELTPIQLTSGRVLTAAIPLVVLSFFGRSLPRLSPNLMARIGLLALLDTIAPYLLLAWAQLHVNSSTAGVMLGTMPLFTTLFVAVTRQEEGVTPIAIAGMLVGFLGIGFLAGPRALDFTNAGSLGMFAAVTAAALYAAATIYSRTLRHVAQPLGLSAVKLALASCVLLPLGIAEGGLNAYSGLSTQGWFGMFMVGFVSTGIGRCVYQWVIVEAGSVRASLVAYIVPLVALVLGWTVLQEPVDGTTIAAALLIAAGVAGVLYVAQLRVLWLRLKSFPGSGLFSAEIEAAPVRHE